MKRDVLSLLEAGNKAQLEKLKENQHKDNWKDIPLKVLYELINQEEMELHNEFATPNGEWIENPDISKIRKEAADVANFAHMIIQHCDKLLKEVKK